MMSVHTVHLVNALTLMALSFLTYVMSLNPSGYDLVPLFFGVVLLALNNGVKYGLKGQTRAAAMLSGVCGLSLISFLLMSLGGDDVWRTVKISVMLITSLTAAYQLSQTGRNLKL
jgi:hypothetical protein